MQSKLDGHIRGATQDLPRAERKRLQNVIEGATFRTRSAPSFWAELLRIQILA